MSRPSPLSRLARLSRLSILLLGSGCVYYNGLYNTKVLAGRAERAEREGRTFDAQALWGQVAVKADTVLTRHPRSKWAGEARYYKAMGLAGAGNCAEAAPVLRQVILEATDPAHADAAALSLSACEGQMGNLAAAGLAVERLVDDPDPVRRAEARWRTGVAYRLSGRAEDAVRILRTTPHPRARGDLAAALAQSGDVSGTIALADTLLQVRDTLAPWGAILAALGATDVPVASTLLDRLLAAREWGADTGAAWLAADAERWMRRDTVTALARYEAAYARAPDRPAGLGARVTALRHRLAATDDLTLLDTVTAALVDLSPSAGVALFEARTLATVAGRLRIRADSLAPAAPQGDLRALLLGESLRDSLRAPRLAVMVWRRAITARPESPYAPKMWLAIAGAEGRRDTALIGRLAAEYPASPYLAVLQGGDDPRFAALEDSLLKFASLQRQQERQQQRQQQRPPARGNRPTTPSSQSAPVQ